MCHSHPIVSAATFRKQSTAASNTFLSSMATSNSTSAGLPCAPCTTSSVLCRGPNMTTHQLWDHLSLTTSQLVTVYSEVFKNKSVGHRYHSGFSVHGERHGVCFLHFRISVTQHRWQTQYPQPFLICVKYILTVQKMTSEASFDWQTSVFTCFNEKFNKSFFQTAKMNFVTWLKILESSKCN